MTWQDQARQLGFGHKIKIPCCSSDPSSYISNSKHGIRMGPCFRCGHTDFERHAGLTIQERLAMRSAVEELKGLKYKPATVSITEAPQEAWLWCLQAGISPEDATNTYSFGWSDKSQRVIVPILQDMRDTGAFIARAVDKRTKPKYVLSANAKGKYWYAGTGPTVIVEDILSAIAVHRAGYRSVAAMGTHFTPELLDIATRTGELVAWLDDDEAGKKAYRYLRKQIGLWDVKFYRVQSNRDPKLHGADEIRQLVEASLGDKHDRY